MDIGTVSHAAPVAPNPKAATIRSEDRKAAADSAQERKEAERSADLRRNEEQALRRRLDIRV